MSTSQKTFDLIPVPHAATVELGHDGCDHNCMGCSFNETSLGKLSREDIETTIDSLSKYWDGVAAHPEKFQLVGQRIVEFLGVSGRFNEFSREDIHAILEKASEHDLHQIAVMCNAESDERAIRDFFELHAKLGASKKGVIALSCDHLESKLPVSGRKLKADATWQMLRNKADIVKEPEAQNFRAFIVISPQNIDDIPEITRGVLETGSLAFVAPSTIHSSGMTTNSHVEGRLLAGTDERFMLNESHRERMEKVVAELRKLKADERYKNLLLIGEANLENMLAVCKPKDEAYVSNCRDRCKFVTEGGEELVATPNIRVRKDKIDGDLKLATCTCFVGLTESTDNYANIRIQQLAEMGGQAEAVRGMYRKLTADLTCTNCPGCNCRTSIDIARGTGLR